MSAHLNSLFQVGLDVLDRPCLIIGGGREAENKAGRLLEAGARLKVVSPTITEPLRQWAACGNLEYQCRSFVAADFDAIFLVLNTVRDDLEFCRQIFTLATERNVLINTYDHTEFSNFGMVALVHPGHLRLSISTSNASPALASRLRQDLEAVFDEEFVDYLDLLAQARQHIRARQCDAGARAVLLRALVADFHLQGHLTYPEDWKKKIKALLECDLQSCGTSRRCSVCALLD
jgi:precorrin-2 dehydrogenase/sirohydrochlorin ferrochelatase